LTTRSHKLLQMMAAVLSAMGWAQATPPARAERPPLGKLIGQLREDAALRARFSLNPRSVFEERGIDPDPYDLPDRLDADDVDRFLSNWTGARGPAAGSRATDAARVKVHPEKLASELPAATPSDPQASGDAKKIAPSSAPVAPDYGPLPGFPARRLPEPGFPPAAASEPSDPKASGNEENIPQQVPEPAPVAPVYGPPPGLRNKLPEPVSPPTPAPEPREPQAPGDAQRSPHRPSSFGPTHAPVYGPPPGFRTKP
jgi:hypothetical protein